MSMNHLQNLYAKEGSKVAFLNKLISTEDFLVKRMQGNSLVGRRRTCSISSEHLMLDKENISCPYQSRSRPAEMV